MNTAITFPTVSEANSPRLSEFELRAWIIQAQPGEVLEYHRGFLAIDRTPLGPPMSEEERSALGRGRDQTGDSSHRRLRWRDP